MAANLVPVRTVSGPPAKLSIPARRAAERAGLPICPLQCSAPSRVRDSKRAAVLPRGRHAAFPHSNRKFKSNRLCLGGRRHNWHMFGKGHKLLIAGLDPAAASMHIHEEQVHILNIAADCNGNSQNHSRDCVTMLINQGSACPKCQSMQASKQRRGH